MDPYMDNETKRSDHYVRNTLLICLGIVLLLSIVITGIAQTPICTGNRLLSLQETLDLPIGDNVWIEYNKDNIAIYEDEAMVRSYKGVIPILRNGSGYWNLNDTWHFGIDYRVWTKSPTMIESKLISWTDSFSN